MDAAAPGTLIAPTTGYSLNCSNFLDLIMLIRAGYDMAYWFPQATPLLLHLNIHPSIASRVLVPDAMVTDPPLQKAEHFDAFGNRYQRLTAGPGFLRVSADAVVFDSGERELLPQGAPDTPVDMLPGEVLPFLVGSRYCETDRLNSIAWRLFGGIPTASAKVAAICNYVHDHITFGYQYARSTKTAWEAYEERQGVCRDYAHLAIAFCRCMNIPARYATGYLGDIGVPPFDAPMDFAACFEVYLAGHWYTFDPRHNEARIGRLLMARGRDAADVALITSFGPHNLVSFEVWTDELHVLDAAANPARGSGLSPNAISLLAGRQANSEIRLREAA